MCIYIYTYVPIGTWRSEWLQLPNCQLTQVPNIVTSEWAVIGNGLHTSHLSQQSLLRIRKRNKLRRVRQRSRHHQSGAGQLPTLDPEWNSETWIFLNKAYYPEKTAANFRNPHGTLNSTEAKSRLNGRALFGQVFGDCATRQVFPLSVFSTEDQYLLEIPPCRRFRPAAYKKFSSIYICIFICICIM